VVVTRPLSYCLFVLLWLFSQVLVAAVLPPDRADVLYHSYDGGGVTVNGPSILVRKSIGDSFSAAANYYVDNVTSASIDVLATASPYTEERTELGLSGDYLRDRTTMSLSYVDSDESDYQAQTVGFTISQEMLGDLTTVSLGYAQGDNTIFKNGDPTFKENATTRSYRVSLSQVITKDSLLSGVFETITDEGYLQNPYRSARYCVPPDPQCTGSAYEPEVYPNTRTSNAIALRGRYYLPYRASVYGGYRYYTDTWGIVGNTFDVGYIHTLKNAWVLELNYRYYTQNSADFYQDIFPYQNSQNFLSRDKELSTYTSSSAGLGITYNIDADWKFIDRGSLNFIYNYIFFNYDDFRNALSTLPPEEQPLYNFSANVIRAYVSIWY
jgi:hypothetical protein